MLDRSDTTDSPKQRDRKRPAEMTGDEIMDEVFDPKVREKLKKLAREQQPKKPKD